MLTSKSDVYLYMLRTTEHLRIFSLYLMRYLLILSTNTVPLDENIHETNISGSNDIYCQLKNTKSLHNFYHAIIFS